MITKKFAFLASISVLTLGMSLDVAYASKKPLKKVEKKTQAPQEVAQDTGPSETLRKYGIETSAKQAIVIDVESGVVLFDKNASEKMYPSSMTKIMTTYILFEMIKQGKLSLDTRFTVSEKAWKTEGTRMFLPLNDTPSVEDLLRGIIIQSGNDACVTAAEGTMGTEESFVMLMNEKAAELGLKDTFFVNSHGLSDEAQLTTCQDLAKLSINLIKQFPELYPIHGEKQFTYNKVSQGNRNPLLYKEMGCDGVKTGHTEAGGYGVVASTTQDGRRLLLVINGCKSMQQRATEAQKLLSWARQAFQNVKVYEKGQLIKTVPVVKGAQDEVAVTVEKDVLVTMAKQASKNYEAMLKLTSPLVAPLKKGQEVGTLELTLPDQSISKIPVVTAVSVEGASFLKRLMGSISYLLWGTSSATKELATS